MIKDRAGVLEILRREFLELLDEANDEDGLTVQDVLDTSVDILSGLIALAIPGTFDDAFIASLGDRLTVLIADAMERDAEELFAQAAKLEERVQKLEVKEAAARKDGNVAAADRIERRIERLTARVTSLEDRAGELLAKSEEARQ